MSKTRITALAGYAQNILETATKLSYIFKYRKTQLICPGRIYGQRTNLMGLYSGGGGGGLIFRRKNASICNLLNLLLFFLFFSIKLVFRHISRRARSEICSELTIKTPEYVTLTKVNSKDTVTSFWSLHC